MSVNVKARKHLSKGVMRVMRTSAFYTTILLRHQMVEDESVNGMCIDGKEIRYSPDDIMTQTPAELGEYLKHMAMHIAFKHHVRSAELKPRKIRELKEKGLEFDKIFDQSADLAINSLCRNENRQVWESEEFKEAPMPGRGKFKELEDGESVESYFPKVAELEEDECSDQGPGEGEGDGNGKGQGQGSGGGGQGGPEGGEDGDDDNDSDDGNGDNGSGENEQKEQPPAPKNFGQVRAAPTDPVQADDDADEIIAAATMAAKQAGEGTGSVQSIIAENEKPVKVDWRSEVSQFFERQCRGRQNYRHVNRRLFGGRIIFPTNKDKSPKRVVFLVDVSGSMSNEAVGAVYNHIEEVINAKQNLTVELVPFDDGVFKDNIVEFTRDNLPISTEARSRVGFGGTRFVPAGEYAEERLKEEDVSGVVMLTDLLPCDRHAFENEFKPNVPWLILSVLEHQFGMGYRSSACNPKWCKVLEIEP